MQPFMVLSVVKQSHFVLCSSVGLDERGLLKWFTTFHTSLNSKTVNHNARPYMVEASSNKKHSCCSETALARKQHKGNNEKRATGGSEKHSHYIFTTLIHRSEENCEI
jgi:hypothetical protein